MSHFSMFVPTKATLKLANRATVHAQVIGIFLQSDIAYVPLDLVSDSF